MKEIELTNGMVTIVDDQDFEHLSQFRWHCLAGDTLTTKYAYCWSDYPNALMMHRLIMDAPSGMVVDHIDNNGLNNRRDNLRIISYGANQTRKRGAKGYHWESSRSKWKAMIMVNGYHYFLGRFGSEEEAALAYQNAQKHFYPELFRNDN